MHHMCANILLFIKCNNFNKIKIFCQNNKIQGHFSQTEILINAHHFYTQHLNIEQRRENKNKRKIEGETKIVRSPENTPNAAA